MFDSAGDPLSPAEAALAQTLKAGAPVLGIETIGERPDGTRFRFLSCPNVLRDGAGAIVGGINLMINVSDRSRAEGDSARLAAIVASSDDTIVSKTLDGRITSWNAGATRMFGYDESEMVGRHITKIIPPELHAEEEGVLARLKNGERIEHFETVRVAKDGRRVEVSLTVSPLRDRSGRVIGASKVSRDITARRQADKTQALLIGELSHRDKNTLATVQAIATHSLRRSADPREFVTSFAGRIQSLAKAHDLLSETNWDGVALTGLIREQVLLGISDSRITWSGPPIQLEAQRGLHLALVLHELGTNARKYGALSVPDGRLTITWQVLQPASGDELRLLWQEQNGPTPSLPSTRGFGTTVIEGSLAPHGGSAALVYGSGGISCQIALPLAARLPNRLALNSVPVFPPAASDDPGSEALRGKRILVVEDEPLIAMEIVATLSEAGCEVVGPTASIRRATELLAGGCDGALLDANLSGQPVVPLAAALQHAGVPFAFVTGYGVDALPAALRDTLLVPKPFTPEKLIAAVRKLVVSRSDASTEV